MESAALGREAFAEKPSGDDHPGPSFFPSYKNPHKFVFFFFFFFLFFLFFFFFFVDANGVLVLSTSHNITGVENLPSYRGRFDCRILA